MTSFIQHLLGSKSTDVAPRQQVLKIFYTTDWCILSKISRLDFEQSNRRWYLWNQPFWSKKFDFTAKKATEWYCEGFELGTVKVSWWVTSFQNRFLRCSIFWKKLKISFVSDFTSKFKLVSTWPKKNGYVKIALFQVPLLKKRCYRGTPWFRRMFQLLRKVVVMKPLLAL